MKKNIARLLIKALIVGLLIGIMLISAVAFTAGAFGDDELLFGSGMIGSFGSMCGLAKIYDDATFRKGK